jgi:hypothetical protein
MEPLTFPDNSAILFGREPDLVFLAARAQYSGITAIVGRPKMGKSWLLTELARRLSSSNSTPFPVQSLSLATPPQYLVGFFEQEGSSADHLLRAVADLYTRWLADSTYRQQAQIFYEQHKSDLVEKSGEAVGTILKELAGLAGKPLEKLGGIVKSAFDALATANRDLISGGLQLPRLQTEQARDLLTWLHEITGRHIVLILDQWEKSTNIELEINLLDAFHRHLDKWPPCHIFLGVRAGNEIRARLQQMHGGFSYERPVIGEPMGIYDIFPMDLSESEKVALPAYLRGRMEEAAVFSGAKPPEVSNDKLLEMIGGFPYVIDQWTRPYILPKLTSIDHLQEQAINANNERYSEFEAILRQLNDSERTVAIRLALVPSCANPDDWKTLRPIILESVGSSILDKLKSLYVLETSSPPSYGHATQREAAYRWFATKQTVWFSDTCEQLVFSLAAEVRDTSDRAFIEALANILPAGTDVALSRTAEALLVSSRAFFGSAHLDSSGLIGIASEIDANHTIVLPLLAIGLYHALMFTNREQGPALRDALLLELRDLSGRYPEDTAVRKQLAHALYRTIATAMQDLTLRDALLAEIRDLSRRYPEDAAVRSPLTNSLLVILFDAERERELPFREVLLAEMRDLSRRYPEDAAVRRHLANGLVSVLNDAKKQRDLPLRDVLLTELRDLSGRYPEDAAVRGLLANGLWSVLDDTMKDQDLPLQDAVLAELRDLSLRYPEDYSVRMWLANGLLSALDDPNKEQDLHRQEALLAELRDMSGRYPEESVVRARLAQSLFSAINYATAKHDLALRDALLAELRDLSNGYPENAAIHMWLARGLLNVLNDAKEEQDFPYRDALLAELRDLSVRGTKETAVRKQLAMGLLNTLFSAKEEHDLSRRDALLTELRGLSCRYPRSATVRESLAKGLLDTLFSAKEELDLSRRDALLVELRDLSDRYPDDKQVCGIYEKARASGA